MIRNATPVAERRPTEEFIWVPGPWRDPALLEWATRMMMVSRALERIGDQAVDIGEQVAFVTTGQLQEFVEEGISNRNGHG